MTATDHQRHWKWGVGLGGYLLDGDGRDGKPKKANLTRAICSDIQLPFLFFATDTGFLEPQRARQRNNEIHNQPAKFNCHSASFPARLSPCAFKLVYCSYRVPWVSEDEASKNQEVATAAKPYVLRLSATLFLHLTGTSAIEI